MSLLWRAGGICSLGVWIYLAFFRGGFWRLRERLRAERRSTERAVSITTVIPARNEAGLIGKAIRSLRAQRFAGVLRVVVADDESSDRTGELAVAAGADQVVRVASRPKGWKGKLWAVSEGIRSTSHSSDYLLLTDADIEYVSPDLLETLTAKIECGYDLVSVMVRLCCQSPAESFLIPAFVFFFFKLYPPGWVQTKRNIAAAAGGCMLIRRDTLEQLGGIESIRNALIDDCALARRVKAVGGRIWLGISDPEITSTRKYSHANEIRAMVSRAAFAQLQHSGLLLLGTALGMVLTYIAPVALLFSGDLTAAALGAAAWLIGAGMFLPTVRYYRAPLWTAFCLPGIALFYLGATLESAWNYWSGRGGEWKGRVQDERGN